MWDRRCRLSIGTKGGKALRGLDLRAFRHGPAAAFFKGAVMTLRVAESDEKYKRRLFFEGIPMGLRPTNCNANRRNYVRQVRPGTQTKDQPYPG